MAKATSASGKEKAVWGDMEEVLLLLDYKSERENEKS